MLSTILTDLIVGPAHRQKRARGRGMTRAAEGDGGLDLFDEASTLGRAESISGNWAAHPIAGRASSGTASR